MSLPIIIVGAGGHAKVVADALLAAGETVIGLTDRDPARHGRTVCGLPVLGDDRVLESRERSSALLANGIGSVGTAPGIAARRQVQERFSAMGWRFTMVRHPAAVISRFATLADGVQVLAAAVVQAGAAIGEGSIVNTAAVVEHDVNLGAWVHVAPGAVVCGDVSIGAESHVGAAAVVRQGLRLGERTLVGSGAVVVRDFSGSGMLLGVPAEVVAKQ